MQTECNVGRALEELWMECEKAKKDTEFEYAWDDVNNIPLPIGEVTVARIEEMN